MGFLLIRVIDVIWVLCINKKTTVSFATQALGIQTETQYRLKLNELFRLTAGPNANIQQRATVLMTQQEWVNNAVKCGAVTAEPLAVFNTAPALLSS